MAVGLTGGMTLNTLLRQPNRVREWERIIKKNLETTFAKTWVRTIVCKVQILTHIYFIKGVKMNIFDICWIMSIIIWLIFFIAMIISYKIYYNSKMTFVFNICQVIMLVFVWGFLFMGA